MKNKSLLPLLSSSLREAFNGVFRKHPECKIAEEIIKADNLIIGINEISSYPSIRPYEYNIKETLRETLIETLNNTITDKARMMSYRTNTFEISYLPEGKEPIYSSDGIWSRENRQSAKPARLIQKLLVKEFKCKEFEDFSNYLQAEIVKLGQFTIVEGSDITKYYNENTYYRISGTLGNSCMRYSECSDYFKIYEDHAKLLVYLRDEKVMGRALLWEIDGNVYMDRYYTCEDYLESIFVEYAESNKWFRRPSNSLLYDGDDQEWLSPENSYSSPMNFNLFINLGDKHYDYYPYMDSFRYYDPELNCLYCLAEGNRVSLSSTDGNLPGVTTVICPICGYTIQIDGDDMDDALDEGFVWSEWREEYICEDCAVYCSYLDTYIGKNDECVYINIGYGNSPAIVPKDLINTSDFALIDGEYYELSCYTDIIYNDTLNCYEFIHSDNEN